MTTSGMLRTLLLTVCTVFLLLFCLAPLGTMFAAEIPFYLAFGWLRFLLRVVPEMTFDPSGLVLAVLALLAFTAGVQWSGNRWIQVLASRPNAIAPSLTRWRPRWTGMAVAILLLLFTAGISIVGIAHQCLWLLTSDDDFLRSSGQAADRTRSKNNLKQLGLGLYNHLDVHGRFPAGGTFDENGLALHSWQTALLPFIDQQSLYDNINRDHAWQHADNREAFRHRISTFENPGFHDFRPDETQPAISHYAANLYVVGARPGLSITTDIPDGATNTILGGEVASLFRAWGDPLNWRDPGRGINTYSDGFGSPFTHGANMLMGDGSVRFVTNDIDRNILRALSTPDGGEPVDSD